MRGFLAKLNDIRIWVRLVVSILVTIIVMWVAFLTWASHEQRKLAIDQAHDFATSLHQMTMAGLTGMMITGTIQERSVFLDQIKQSNHVEALKVFRSAAVIQQFGPGRAGELPGDEVEHRVLTTGVPHFEVVDRPDGQRLRAIMPAIGVENYLGKNCLNCHKVGLGTVLGAVSMEISLDRANRSVKEFNRDALFVVFLLLPIFGFFTWYFIGRMVTRPLKRLTNGLIQIADGDIEERHLLPRRGNDEIGQATQAFNRVMTKAGELIRAQQLSRIVFENALESITVTDANSRIQMVNRAFIETTGYSLDEVIGKTPAILKSGKQGADFYLEFWKTLQEKGEWRGEIWNKRKNGTIYPEWLNVSAVRNKRGEVEHYIAIFSDITERKQREELIAFQAFHDALTGLPNRTLFRDRLDQTLAAARRHKYRTPAVMFLDLDRFKQINDTLGHDAGDELLKEVANRLRRCVRESDTVARMGGDEFTVLLPEISSLEDAHAVGEKIIDLMRQPVVLAGSEVVVTTSIGISMYPKDGRDADSLMKCADAAMYHVKGAGRAGLAFFAPELLGKPSRRHELESRLIHALSNGEFVLHYQPMVELVSGRPFGLEALLRWKDENGELLLPEEFLTIAEELGLMADIGHWVLNEACRRGARWIEEGYDLTLAINLSVRQFHRIDFVRAVQKVLADTRFPPNRLQLEISEPLAVRDIDFTLRTLATLHGQGIRIAIDDYGTGYLNFTQLRHLPLDAVKLDRTLVRDALAAPENKAIAAALIKSANILGLQVIAEGVETRAQAELLRSFDCALAQGFLFSRPASAEQIDEYLRDCMGTLHLGHS
jgi:diguanylate cyclase (GGDEF)-like protein/PAS domain S-box-containing protein